MKGWKYKFGANTKVNGGNTCDMLSCPNLNYSGCTLGRNPRICKDRNLRPNHKVLK